MREVPLRGNPETIVIIWRGSTSAPNGEEVAERGGGSLSPGIACLREFLAGANCPPPFLESACPDASAQFDLFWPPRFFFANSCPSYRAPPPWANASEG